MVQKPASLQPCPEATDVARSKKSPALIVACILAKPIFIVYEI
jgi:hypothetical protein